MVKRDIPVALPGESDDDYDARLKALGITDEEFDEWFESEFPLTTDKHIEISVIGEDATTTDLFGVEHKENTSLSCCYKILQMVGVLHSRGYQRIRIFPYGREMLWRCELAPADLFDPENGACMEYSVENDEAGLIARVSNGDGCRPFGWKRDISRLSLPRLADLFLERFPLIASRTLGSDWAYAGWYQEMLLRTSATLMPMAFYRDAYEEEVYIPLRLWAVGAGQDSQMPSPPLYRP